MNWLRQLRIGQRLGVGFALVLALMVMVALAGWLGIRSVTAGLQTVYEDRTVGLGQLAEINRMNQRNRVLVMDMLQNPAPVNVERNGKELAENAAAINKLFDAYQQTASTPEETEVTRTFAAARKEYEEKGLNPMRDAMQQADLSKATSFYEEGVAVLAPAVEKAGRRLLDIQVEEARREYEKARTTQTRNVALLMGLTLGAIALGACLAWWIAGSVTQPVYRAVQLAEAVADGDLTQDVEVRGRDELAQLLRALGGMNDKLAEIVAKVRHSADSIATGSAEIANGNADLSQRTEEQASNLQQTAASMEQMNATVRQNADTARAATQLASSASSAADRGGQVVGQVVATMNDISASSRKIADIIGVIDGIAFQTNILALNAAVEAARAGEQGRGFAVVAGEVRLLASRSAEAAKEIKALIGQSVEKVESGSRQVAEAGGTMEELVSQVRRVADLIGEIDSASTEQSQGISQVSEAVSQLDHVTQQNAALVEEAAAAADSLKEQAKTMAEVVSVFRLR